MARTTTGRRAGTLTPVELPSIMEELDGTQEAYRTGSGCSVICGREPAKRAPAGIWLPPNELLLWHISISHRHRLPTWDEIADVRYALVPDDVTMAMLLPPSNQYVNEHEFCMHCWQIDDKRMFA